MAVVFTSIYACNVFGVLTMYLTSFLVHSQFWAKFGNSIARSVGWPDKRQGHAACVLSGPLLVIVGGKNGEGMICDGWFYDFTKNNDKPWKKV